MLKLSLSIESPPLTLATKAQQARCRDVAVWIPRENDEYDIQSWAFYESRAITTGQPKVLLTKVYETIESLGAGEIYTTCDGVPRFRRLGPVTSTRKKLISVVITSQQFTFPSDIGTAVAPKSPLMESRVTTWCDAENDVAGGCMIFPNQEVILIHWPPRVTGRDICATDGVGDGKTLAPLPNMATTVVTSALTFRGADLYERGQWENGNVSFYNDRSDWEYIGPSTMKGPFTFTSPTVYIAHRPLDASIQRIFQTRGEKFTTYWSTRLHNASILTLHSSEISSRRLFHPRKPVARQYVQLVAQGRFERSTLFQKTGNQSISEIPAHEIYETMPFNFAHFEDPVPASVYYDARENNCWGSQTHCGTITDDSYQPQLVIQSSVWNDYSSLFSDLSCEYPPLVDPPVALQQIAHDERVLAVPTAIPAFETAVQTETPYQTPSPAQPLPGVQPNGPLPTGQIGDDGQRSSDRQGTVVQNSLPGGVHDQTASGDYSDPGKPITEGYGANSGRVGTEGGTQGDKVLPGESQSNASQGKSSGFRSSGGTRGEQNSTNDEDTDEDEPAPDGLNIQSANGRAYSNGNDMSHGPRALLVLFIFLVLFNPFP